MEKKIFPSIEKQLTALFEQCLEDGASANKVSRKAEVDSVFAGLYGDKGRVKSLIRHLLAATYQDGANGKTAEDCADVIAARVAKAVKSCGQFLTTEAPVGKVGFAPLVKEKYALTSES